MPMTARDRKKLLGCHAAIITIVAAVFDDMDDLGFSMMVTDGARTVSQQKALYAQGRTTPGKKVTDSDGVKKKSNHQSGRAVDCTFVVNGKPSWADSLPWAEYGASAKRHGARWGGDWTRPDRPHIELPPETV